MSADTVDGAMAEAVGDALDRLCFLADAVLAKPEESMEAASRRGLGRMLEDIAVALAEVGFMPHGARSTGSSAGAPKEEEQC